MIIIIFNHDFTSKYIIFIIWAFRSTVVKALYLHAKAQQFQCQTQDGKLSSEKYLQTLNFWSNLLSWALDLIYKLPKLWESTLLDACSLQDSKMLGISLVLFTMQLLNLATNQQFNHTLINTILTSAPAQMMQITYPNI